MSRESAPVLDLKGIEDRNANTQAYIEAMPDNVVDSIAEALNKNRDRLQLLVDSNPSDLATQKLEVTDDPDSMELVLQGMLKNLKVQAAQSPAARHRIITGNYVYGATLPSDTNNVAIVVSQFPSMGEQPAATDFTAYHEVPQDMQALLDAQVTDQSLPIYSSR